VLVAKVDIRVPAEYFVEVLWKFLGIFSTDKQLILNEKMAEVHGNRNHAGGRKSYLVSVACDPSFLPS